MAWRQFATGNDGCSDGESGAGPSNAAAGLANVLLGRSAKDQERLRELPGLQGASAPAPYGQSYMPSAEAVAQAAAEGDLPQLPGISSERANAFNVGEFLQHAQPQGMSKQQLQHFDAIYQQAAQQQHRLAHSQMAPQHTMWAPAQAEAGALTPCFQSFMHSGKLRTDFRPMPLPAVRLSRQDQCRVRDRSTIFARQMYADRGDAFADEQVGKLLHSLNIDVQQLPAGQMQEEAMFNRAFQAGRSPHLQELSAAAEVSAGGQMAARHLPPDWAAEFAQLGLREPSGRQPPPDGWLDDFQADQQRRMRWADDFEQSAPPSAWVEEFDQSQQVSQRDAGQTAGRADAATLQNSKALADVLSRDANPKMQSSKFLQFISKMSRGEIVLEDGQAKEAPAAVRGMQWAEDFGQEQGEAQLEAAWNQTSSAQQWAHDFSKQPAAERPAALDEWAEQFAAGSGADWADGFAEELATGTDVDAWANDFAREAAAQHAAAERGRLHAENYVFKEDNPFLGDAASFARGKELFRNGLLSEAVLAFEAEVQRTPNNVEAWRLLGNVHAENDDDSQAIAALGNAYRADPSNLEVLLSLGVSYTNELDQAKALSYLQHWLAKHPTHGPLPAPPADPLPQDSSQRMSWLTRAFERAAAARPADGDLQAALGVLHNLSREYGRATTCFRAALQVQPTNYSLWNKLGATLANMGQSYDAITAYQRALGLKPNYMRAWTNMGISQANVGDYEASARYYTRALSLNPAATNVWGYLRTSLACAGRMDLMTAVDEENLQALLLALPLE